MDTITAASDENVNTSKSLRKRRRNASSSPEVKSKRSEVTQLPLRSKNGWSDDEKEELMKFVQNSGDKTDWQECANHINSMFQCNKTRKSCSSFYRRFVGTTPFMCDTGTQTDITLSTSGFYVFASLKDGEYGKEEKCSSTNELPSSTPSLRNLLENSEEITQEVTKILVDNQENSEEIEEIEEISQEMTKILVDSQENGEDKYHEDEVNKIYIVSPVNDPDKERSALEHDHSYSKKKPPVKKRRLSAPLKRKKKNISIVHSLQMGTKHLPVISTKEIMSLKKTLENIKSIDYNTISQKILTIPGLKKGIIDVLSETMGRRPDKMRNKKNGFISVLMKKDFDSLKDINFADVIMEFQEQFPELLQMIKSIMISSQTKELETKLSDFIPRLVMIYSIIMQSRHHNLSRIQRIIAMCLADNISDQAVYDRLNRLGVSSSYCVTLQIFNEIGSMYPELLVKALKEGRYLRFVGDNLNFSVGTSNESLKNHKHMVHMFVSTALISDHHYLSKPEPPQIPFDDLSVESILLNKAEYDIIRRDVTKLLVDITCDKLPQLQFLKRSVPNSLSNPEHSNSKTTVIPLPCLPYNEQLYQDDVKILEWYQKLSEQIIRESEIDPNTKFQIGGDQLTRERLTGAMLLRYRNQNITDQFGNIGRCTFEFFHLGMNYLEKAIFSELWNEKGIVEVGTLRGECERLSRKTVDTNVMKAYDADKRFALEYMDAVAIQAVMDYFGMDDINDMPKTHPLPKFDNSEEQKDWVYQHFGNIVDQYIYPAFNQNFTERGKNSSNDEKCYIEVRLGNGRVLQIPLESKQQHPQPKLDKVKDYAHLSLEVCFTFKYFLELVKSPDRDRFLGLLKVMMIHLKSHSINAKYPKEILRMLVQQYSVYGLREACQIFQACFVNLHGKVDTHVPADLVQEWNVKECKSHIKHMFSNKSEKNIVTRTSALPGIHDIASNFDKEAGTIVRAKRHKEKKCDLIDEQRLMDDMMSIKPFTYIEGRAYKSFQAISKSLVVKVEGYDFHRWIKKNKDSFFI